MFGWFRKKEDSSKFTNGVTEMFYRFLCFPNGSGHVELCSDLEHNIGYAGSFADKKAMFEILEHLVIVMPPKSEYDTIIKFVYRHEAG